jgi:uncharacterized integral membrane protein (TIGR00697 family)
MIPTKQTLTVVFATSIAIANITAAKLSWFELPGLGGVAIPAGFVAFGVAFLCSDLMTEFYGRDYTHKVVNGTIIALIGAYLLTYVAILLPVAPFYGAHEAYTTTLSASAGIVAASVITLTLSQHVDVELFARLKTKTGGSHKWLRNLGSTTVSQLLDTVVFIGLAFTVFPILQGQDPLLGTALLLTIIGQYVMKLVVALGDTPIFYVATLLNPEQST